MTFFDTMRKSAVISLDGQYRYQLGRVWAGSGHSNLLTFVMLNPSTADAETDDQTIRQCIYFARRDKFDGICVVNLYAFRATKPEDLWKAADPQGPENASHLIEAAKMARVFNTPIVCAWGLHGGGGTYSFAVICEQYADLLFCLGRTKAGYPRHPLYIAHTQELEVYR